MLLSLLGSFLGFSSLSGQFIEVPAWEFSVEISEGATENTLNLDFEAEISNGCYMNSSDFSEVEGLLVTTFGFDPSDAHQLQGAILPQGQQRTYNDLWEGGNTYFTGTARFLQEVLVKEGSPVIEETISYQICSDQPGPAIPFRTPFRLNAEGELLLVTALKNPPPEVS